MNLKLQLARRIKSLRTEHGLSRVELGRLCGFTGNSLQSRVGHWETGRRSPKLGDLKRIAKALHVSIAELLPGATPEHDEPPLLAWHDLMARRIKNIYRVPLIHNACAPAFNKGDIIGIDPRARLVHHDLVLAAYGDTQPVVCRYHHHNSQRFFKTLEAKPRRFSANPKTTQVFGKIISKTILFA